ncbi:glycoside hydrolase family 3 N-terminal domain-containing protein [candidate division KSB1 bacterium]
MAQEKWADSLLQNMSLEEKIGQMIFHAVTPAFINKEHDYAKYLEKLITEVKIGGIHVFAAPTYETAFILNKYQSLAETPLLVTADMERGSGSVVRNEIYYGNDYFTHTPDYLTGGGVQLPPLMAIGAADSEELAYSMGRITAVEGRSVGIHQNFAPVMDINNNPDNPIINYRSIGEDQKLVERLGTAYLKGIQDNGMIATAKHFPGHGDTDVDTHIELPFLKINMSRLEKTELPPFEAVINSGVKSIMSAHIALPEITGNDLPATLSGNILTDLLRNKLNFQGLIVTDAMVMGGILNRFDSETSAVMATKAGADMLLLFKEPEKAAEGILKAVNSGDISEQRINESVKRILNAKQWIGLNRKKMVDLNKIENILGKPEHFETAEKISRKAVTLLKNENNLLPFSEKNNKYLIRISDDYKTDYGKYFKDQLYSSFGIKDEFFLWSKSTDNELQEIADKIPSGSIVICPAYIYIGAWKGSVQIPGKIAAFLKVLKNKGVKIVVISFGSPYIYGQINFIDCYLCAYYGTYELEKTVVHILAGKINPEGRLPVSIPGYFKFGDGLTY